MNMSEFKAWFDGFTENIDGAPSAKQWKRITEQIAEVDETENVYIDRYTYLPDVRLPLTYPSARRTAGNVPTSGFAHNMFPNDVYT